MKKTILTLCIGMIIGLMMGSVTGAFAAIGDKVEAAFAEFSFIINGENVVLDADPLVYQGSTYLPVRSVLNAVGYDVGYLADSRTITADKSVDSLLAESDTILSKEVDIVPVGELTIEVIDARIETILDSIRMVDIMINHPNTEATTLSFALESKEKLEKSLAEFQAKKAALETQ